jgi:alpha-tubulin suppressor-like RCC1 family protein
MMGAGGAGELQYRLYTFGLNNSGQLGLGNTTNRSSPVQVGALTTWLSLAAGYGHTAAIKTDGTLWTFGRNTYGQLGLGDTTTRSSPVQVGALTTWLSVAAGANMSAAITEE